MQSLYLAAKAKPKGDDEDEDEEEDDEEEDDEVGRDEDQAEEDRGGPDESDRFHRTRASTKISEDLTLVSNTS